MDKGNVGFHQPSLGSINPSLADGSRELLQPSATTEEKLAGGS
jgi:hypothetical protein